MLFTDDFAVDKTDDFMIMDGDILSPSSGMRSTLENAKRRVSARSDDFVFTPAICAGIETFLQSYVTDISLSEIEQSMRYALTNTYLFNNKDINIFFDKTNQGKLGVIIKFNIPNASASIDEDDLTFSTYIDVQNQRSFS